MSERARRVWTVVAASLMVATPSTGSAQTGCPSSVRPAAADGYSERPDLSRRCEGLYQRAVGGSTVHFMAWAWAPTRYDVDEMQSMSLSWLSPENVEVTLQVDALPEQNLLAYRMDAIPPVGGPPFTWSATLMRTYRVTPRRLRTILTFPSGSGPVYVPVRAGLDAACRDPRPELVLFAGQSIRRITVAMREGTDLGVDPLRVDTLEGSRQRGRFTVPVPPVDTAGLYTLTLSATSRTTGREIQKESFQIYHPAAWDVECLPP